ncbi:MAG: hypothetical protein AABY18_02660 [Candidatus Thermoplasmatota archaeon]
MDLLDDESLIDLRRRAKSTDPAAVLEEERRRRAAGKPANAQTQAVEPPPSSNAASNGMCSLCATRPARGTCAMCGRAACAADLWIMLRLCRTCASDRDVERGQRGAQPESGNWLGGGSP